MSIAVRSIVQAVYRPEPSLAIAKEVHEERLRGSALAAWLRLGGVFVAWR